MDAKKLTELKKELEADKKALETELESVATKDGDIKDNWNAKRAPMEDASLEEMADEAGEYENRVSLEQNLELKLRDVNMALDKMESGTYGICESCQKEIEVERLEANPAAKLCLKCKGLNS